MPRKVAACRNCGKEREIRSKGRCSACTAYEIRTGNPRPERLYNRPLLCIDCKIRLTSGHLKYCEACGKYRLNHNGKKRPAYMRKGRSGVCRNPNCQKPLSLEPLGKISKGYCCLCRDYYYTNGTDRPIRYCRNLLEPGYVYCENPGCDSVLLERSAKRNRKGRCYLCHKYLKKTGQERPSELCPKRVELGWCECGEIATREVEIMVGGISETGKLLSVTDILCENCYIEGGYDKCSQ